VRFFQRAPEVSDMERYQTVYARFIDFEIYELHFVLPSVPGAVAAPTAGLHFDKDFLGALLVIYGMIFEKLSLCFQDKGVKQGFVTLHVGSGTFMVLCKFLFTCIHLYSPVFTPVFTCVHTCIHLYSHLYSPVFTCIHLYSPVFTPVFTCIHTCIHLYSHLCSPVFTCIHLCSPVFTCVHLCSPVFTCIHLYSHLCSPVFISLSKPKIFCSTKCIQSI
jgi:hypothetical protein